MIAPDWCERIQDAWLSRAISGSVWGYPIAAALHVLAFALAVGTLLVPSLRHEVRWIRRAGVGFVVLSGALLFAAGAPGYYKSTSFRIKLVLLALLAANAIVSRPERTRLHFAVSLALWAAVIFASRGIAFF